MTTNPNPNPNQSTTVNTSSGTGGCWYVPAQFYDLKPLNLSPAQPIRIVPTPPASPNLCIIQEENPNVQFHSQQQQQQQQLTTIPTNLQSPTTINGDDLNSQLPHPQISVTDVQGSEITLVALSDHSQDSEDSLDAQSSITMQGLLISEPLTDMPSITRGVGRKSSLEIENQNYERRESDKSLGFSDDSLSNDLVSPSYEQSGASSGFKSGGDSEITEARLSPDSLSDRRMSEECYELPLPHECSDLDSSRIIEIVKQTIDSKMPPKCFIYNSIPSTDAGNNHLNNPNTNHTMNPSNGGNGNCSSDGCSASPGDVPFQLDISNLSLEYSGGLQIELQVYGGKCKDNCIKFRRISGDQLEYGKLCQQLMSSLTV